jgi:hypothetical protein
VAFAVSTHNPKDQYNKAMARDVAIGRLEKGLMEGPYTGGVWAVSLVKEVKKDIIEIIASGKYPERTKKAARLWLETRRAE